MTRFRICSPLRTVLSAWLAMPPLVGATFTLVLSPVLLAALLLAALLLAALLISAVVTFIVVFDGESTWFEGATLIGLHILLATCFWWG